MFIIRTVSFKYRTFFVVWLFTLKAFKQIWPLLGTHNSWPLNSVCSLTCHTLCDTDQPFIMDISETRDNHICCWSLGSGAVTIYLNDVGLSRTFYHYATAAVIFICSLRKCERTRYKQVFEYRKSTADLADFRILESICYE